MKRLYFVGFALFLIAVLPSCKKEKKVFAAFSFTAGNLYAPCTVQFENNSKEASSYLWDFGDGTTSSEPNPSKTYTVSGTYKVTLTAYGESGHATTFSRVLVQPPQLTPPVAGFTFSDTSGMAPYTVNFTNTSLNAVSYLWDFGDGATSTLVHPSHAYTSGGNFTITLTATNNAGTNQAVGHINITVPTHLRITNASVSAIPFVDSLGLRWDSNGWPDVYFKLLDHLGNQVFLGSYINDVTIEMLPVSWRINPALEISDFNSFWLFEFYDFDNPGPDRHIGNIAININEFTSGPNAFPALITKTQDGITLRLNAVWY